MNLHDSDKCSIQIIGFGLFRVHDFDRESSAGNRENGTTVEIFGELFSVKCGGGDNQSEIRSSFDCLFQQSEEDISCDCPLVRFVKHDNGVSLKVRIQKNFSLEHSIGHVLDLRVWAGTILETDGISNLCSELAANFLGHTFSH